ncbi:NAD(P)H-binding protein [Campylobacter jejuni]|nr:NAD(P)-dependent oxidoreductase [Campylobacter jejuni]EHN6901729.1 NAD(P)H-binding protein [Campylobacter jejuni]EHN6903096.1 NAD(P)H-binding protein [Campylobacter jejuni]EHN6916577.1 NAD(P)H-binding protein [Campylobacter jejuni]EHN6917036.1 NAD(P)H-binding protein [Campylobacter jejuni]
MKIAVLAANGKAGSAVVNEALNQDFEVSAFVRKQINIDNRVRLIIKDIFNLKSNDLEGYDVIVDAFGEWKDLSLHIKHIKHLYSILKNNPAKLVVVGGAGSLFLNDKTRLMDSVDFPKEYLGIARAMAEVLDFLKDKRDINWLYFSPAAEFYEGIKTNHFKLIGENFELNSKNQSRISYADYAVALLNLARDREANHKRVSIIEL